MHRRCDGTDLALLSYFDKNGRRRAGQPEPGEVFTPKPCDCGAVFDDVAYRTVYPHERI